MNVSGYNASGQAVTVVSVNVNGHNIYETYIDGSGNMKIDKLFLSGDGMLLLTSAVIN